MRTRFRGCANGLNRATIQMEKSLDKSLDRELPPAPAPTTKQTPEPTPEPVPEPVNDIPDAELEYAVNQARAAINAHRNRLSGARPATGQPPMTEQNGAMMDTLRQLGIPIPTGPAGGPPGPDHTRDHPPA